MSDLNEETPIINDAVTSDDTGFSGDAGEQSMDDESQEVESSENSEESVEVQAETTDELKEEIEEAIEDGADESVVKEMIREFQLKVNGKNVTKTIDLSDEDAVRRELQLAAAARPAMQESAELRKLYEQEIQRLKSDPWAVLKELDIDPDELAEDRIRQRVEELKKSPEQVDKERIQRELNEARAELNKQKEQAENAKFEQLQMEAATELEGEISKALDGHSTLPQSPKTVSRIADAMLWAMENGFEDVSAGDVIPTVEAEIKQEFNQLMDALGEDAIESFVGKRNMDKMRKKRLNSMKTNNINNIKEVSKKEVKEDTSKKKLRYKDYFKNL